MMTHVKPEAKSGPVQVACDEIQAVDPVSQALEG